MSHEVKLLILGEIVFMILVVLGLQARRYFAGVSRMKRRGNLRGATTIAPSRAALLARPADSPGLGAARNAARGAASPLNNPGGPLMTTEESALRAGTDEFGTRKKAPWEAFINDKQLLEAYRVTPAELESLRHTAMLGTVQSKEDILFILKTIRGSGRL